MRWLRCLDDLFLLDRFYLPQALVEESRIQREQGDLGAARSSAARAAALLVRCDPGQEALRGSALAALAAASAPEGRARSDRERLAWGEQLNPM